jgi:DNA primase
MQTNWNYWWEQIGGELYNSPSAYASLFPELADLHQRGREYRSSYKLNGEKRNKEDKTVILEAAPLVVIEHGEPAHNIVRYIMDRDGCDRFTVARRMADLVGMELPQGDGMEKWLERMKQKELLDTVQEYYKWCLRHTESPTADAVREYVKNRFTDTEIDTMGLGFIPNKKTLKTYLLKYYDAKAVGYFIDSMPYWAGREYHHFTIPIYIAGKIYSFIYRHLNQANLPADIKESKYLYHKRKDDLQKENPYGVNLKNRFAYIPSSLHNTKELVIVEGQLDCLHLQAAGFKNAVSAGTNNISTKQVEDAIQRGCRRFIIMFDADGANPKDPDKNFNERIAAAHSIAETAKRLGMAEDIKVNIAELPQPEPTQKIDPDSYLKDNGADAVQKLIDNARKRWHWQYELDYKFNKYRANMDSPTANAEDMDKVVELIKDTYDGIVDTLGQYEFKRHLGSILGVTEREAVEVILDEHRQKRDKAKAQKQAADLMKQAGLLMDAGKTTEALKLQDKAAALLAGLEAQQEYEKLLHRTTRAELVEGLKRMPEAIATGLYLGEKKPENEILLPAGALSILAAPTSHGKTTMLVALAVNAARSNPNKEYYLLSYEEAVEPIIIKAASCYAGVELSASNRRTLQHYLTTGSWKYAYEDSTKKQQEYQEKEAEFFNMLEQGRLHLHYTDMVCENLCTSIKKLAASGTLGGVFIDYVQYIELATSLRNYRRDEEISKICKMLKDAAVDTGTPIVLAAQFNRKVTDPTKLALQNIGEGGDIERKAAFCLGFWNNDMPMLDTKDINQAELQRLTSGNTYDVEDPHKNKSITTMVLKNRSGVGTQAGTAGLLSFNGNIGTVGNYEETVETAEEQSIIDFSNPE